MAGAPFVAIRTDVRKDERFTVLGEICGYSRHEAIGRMVDLWAWCTDRRLQDAPDDCRGYAVSEAVACRFLGPKAVQGLLGGWCDAFALAEQRTDGLLYLRGTEDSVSRQRGHRASAVAGGEANAATASRAGGRFVSDHTESKSSLSATHSDKSVSDLQIHQLSPAAPPAEHQQPPAASPAVDQLTPATIHYPQATDHKPDPESEIPVKAKRAHRVDPMWVPARTPANEQAEAVAKARGVDLRAELVRLHDWALGNGAKRSDWDAVWRNWTRNAKPGQRAGPHGGSQAVLGNLLTDIARLEREEAERK